jgi:LmbE family N-acetylglucosaminyl deacetylase
MADRYGRPMEPILDEGYVPQVRPHYRVEGNRLFFLISRRPTFEMSDADLRLFLEIDGKRTMASITRGEKVSIDRIRRWYESDILELVPPTERLSKPHLVVVEPHMDDAVLCAGGRLLHRRGRARITILSVVKYSNFTTYWHLKRDFLDIDAVTSLRLKESGLAAALLGADHRWLDWKDAPLRFYPGDKWSAENLERTAKAANSFLDFSPDPEEVSILEKKLHSELELLKPDELWIPMGLGPHIDHRTVRSACVRMLAGAPERFAETDVQMYEDLPYNEPDHAVRIRDAYMLEGTRISRCTEDITDVFEEKLRIISVFASQFKRSFMEPLIRRCAEKAAPTGSGKLHEAYFPVDRPIAQPRESALAPNKWELDLIRGRAKALFKTRTAYRHIIVIATPSANLGRLRTDGERLLSMFPNCGMTLYAPGKTAWQIGDDDRQQIDVEEIGDGIADWIRAALRAICRARTPVVILWRDSGRRTEGWKGWARNALELSFRRIVFARSLGDFCLVLEEENRGLDRP